jgi:hypothetical protein
MSLTEQQKIQILTDIEEKHLDDQPAEFVVDVGYNLLMRALDTLSQDGRHQYVIEAITYIVNQLSQKMTLYLSDIIPPDKSKLH